jgi:hypothetical protein
VLEAVLAAEPVLELAVELVFHFLEVIMQAFEFN